MAQRAFIRSMFGAFRRVMFLYLASMGLLFPAQAQQLTADLEVMRLSSVGASWQTVSLLGSYTSPVVVCSYNLPSSASPPATVQVRNASAGTFEVRIRQFPSSTTVSAAPVHCIVADEGAYNIPGGPKFEARKVLSTGTNGNSPGWTATDAEEVTSSITQTYASPAVLGQVMTANDADASVFWTFNCGNRGNPPFSNGRICVGKHIGMINDTRAPETLGYIVVEGGSGVINGVSYEAALGANSVLGVGNSPPYSYSVSQNYDVGIVTQNGENGGNGGWAVLYGSDPLPSSSLRIAIEEEIAAGDTTRRHIAEQVGYWLFKNDQTADLDVTKNSSLSLGNALEFAVPGSTLDYEIVVSNSGTSPVNTVFVVDKLPAQVEFVGGDMAGAGSGPVEFWPQASGLTFSPGVNVAYSDSTAAPAEFADCTLATSAGFESAVRHICIQPSGQMNSGSFGPSQFTVRLRVKIK